tara:strand:+ start:1685 stop:2335 length:651 start_codon:yes stop_codon:yes gene_type:complete
MIIQCKSCSRKFVVKDSDIPKEGRTVKCGYCSVSWHQIPISIKTDTIKEKSVSKTINKVKENLSVDAIKASDGKTYKFLGSQWAELLPSGKTGLFAKKKIGKELDKLTGRKIESTNLTKKKKVKKELDPSSGKLNDEKQLPQIYVEKGGLGFFGYIFIIIILGFSIVGVLKTFENDLINNFPEIQYIFELLDEQLEFFSETVKNMIVIFKDLINSY